jgi:hypothetical protein
MSEPNAAPRAAKNLRVRITYSSQEKVGLTYDAAAAAKLAELLPAEIAEKLKADGVDVAAIAAKAVANNFPPGNLLETTAGTTHIRVWLS